MGTRDIDSPSVPGTTEVDQSLVLLRVLLYGRLPGKEDPSVDCGHQLALGVYLLLEIELPKPLLLREAVGNVLQWRALREVLGFHLFFGRSTSFAMSTLNT